MMSGAPSMNKASRGKAGTSGRAPGYQGEVVDRLLPLERRFRFDIGSDHALVDAVDAEVKAIGGTPFVTGTPL